MGWDGMGGERDWARSTAMSGSDQIFLLLRLAEETENQGHSMADPAADLICRRCKNMEEGVCLACEYCLQMSVSC